MTLTRLFEPHMGSALASLPSTDQGVALALLILVGVVAASALRRVLHVPLVVGLMLIGAIASPLVLDLMHSAELDPWKPLIDLAVAVLLFDLGGRLHLRWFKDNPWFAASALLEGLLAAAAVAWTLHTLGASGASVFIAAAVAASTSPIIALAVVHELHPRGQVGERLLAMSAVNSVLAVLALKLWPIWDAARLVPAPTDALGLAAGALYVSCGSFLLGLACGWLLDAASRLSGDRETLPVLQTACVVLAALAAIAWGLSPLLSLLAAGMTARSRMRHRLAVEPGLGSAGAILSVLLFVSMGMLFDLGALASAWPWVLAIVGARLLGKGLAVGLLARPSGLGLRQAFALTVALQPMSGLAMLVVSGSFAWPAQLPGADRAVLQALLAATTLMQASGPLWAQWALRFLARETPTVEASNGHR